jgi:hypothetical protein
MYRFYVTSNEETLWLISILKNMDL